MRHRHRVTIACAIYGRFVFSDAPGKGASLFSLHASSGGALGHDVGFWLPLLSFHFDAPEDFRRWRRLIPESFQNFHPPKETFAKVSSGLLQKPSVGRWTPFLFGETMANPNASHPVAYARGFRIRQRATRAALFLSARQRKKGADPVGPSLSAG